MGVADRGQVLYVLGMMLSGEDHCWIFLVEKLWRWRAVTEVALLWDSIGVLEDTQ